MKILIVDDHMIIRRGLVQILDEFDGQYHSEQAADGVDEVLGLAPQERDERPQEDDVVEPERAAPEADGDPPPRRLIDDRLGVSHGCAELLARARDAIRRVGGGPPPPRHRAQVTGAAERAAGLAL